MRCLPPLYDCPGEVGRCPGCQCAQLQRRHRCAPPACVAWQRVALPFAPVAHPCSAHSSKSAATAQDHVVHSLERGRPTRISHIHDSQFTAAHEHRRLQHNQRRWSTTHLYSVLRRSMRSLMRSASCADTDALIKDNTGYAGGGGGTPLTEAQTVWCHHRHQTVRCCVRAIHSQAEQLLRCHGRTVSTCGRSTLSAHQYDIKLSGHACARLLLVLRAGPLPLGRCPIHSSSFGSDLRPEVRRVLLLAPKFLDLLDKEATFKIDSVVPVQIGSGEETRRGTETTGEGGTAPAGRGPRCRPDSIGDPSHVRCPTEPPHSSA